MDGNPRGLTQLHTVKLPVSMLTTLDKFTKSLIPSKSIDPPILPLALNVAPLIVPLNGEDLPLQSYNPEMDKPFGVLFSKSVLLSKWNSNTFPLILIAFPNPCTYVLCAIIPLAMKL